jgi:5-methyltetrahydropteroyltriglutamate--homocysteine methyltransferase
MQTSKNRFLTTHAGSLPKPKALVHLHAERAAGRAIELPELAALTESAEKQAVAKQVECGVDVINDGEVGRESFFTYVRHRMSGFAEQSQRPIMRDITMYPSFLEFVMKSAANGEQVSLLAPPACTGAVHYRDAGAVAADCARLKRHVAPFAGKFEEAFITSPSPGIIAAAMANKHYASMADYVVALGEALAVEYRAILNAGFVLQIDAPDLAMERHTLFADKPLGEFLDFVKVVVRAINRGLEGLPKEQVRLHVCWGNYNGPHEHDVPLADIWSEIAKAQVGGFLLSLANPRHEHEVELFEKGILPRDTMLIAGVIDTTSNYVEHPQVVATRIERAAKAVGDPSRVMAGTDCGFETSAGFVTVVEDVVWAKLRALRDGAQIASKRVFG